jgi:hypothetical protein
LFFRCLPSVVAMPDAALGRALMVRSPVGHAVLITEACGQ